MDGQTNRQANIHIKRVKLEILGNKEIKYNNRHVNPLKINGDLKCLTEKMYSRKQYSRS